MFHSIKNGFIACTLLALVIGGCKNSDLDPPIGSDVPVFEVTGSVNGQPYMFAGGIDGKYMFTGWDSSSNNGRILTGYLAPDNCDNPGSSACPGTLGFQFFVPSTIGTSSIAPGTIPYLLQTTNDVVYDLTLTPRQVIATEYLWSRDNASLATTIGTPLGFRTDQFGLQYYELKVLAPQFDSEVRQSINPFNQEQNYWVGFQATYDGVSDALLSASTPPSVGGLGASALIWPDTFTSPDSSLSYSNTNLLNLPILVRARNPSNPDIIVSAQITKKEASLSVAKTIGFDHNIELMEAALQEGVVIIWVDNSGQVWRSDRAQQIGDQVFSIEQVTPYIMNERGQNTLQLTVSYDCLLMPADTVVNTPGPIRISGTGIIGVAIP
jgi:hypothetical protein